MLEFTRVDTITKIATFSEDNCKKENIEVIHGNRVFDEIDGEMSNPLCRLSLPISIK